RKVKEKRQLAIRQKKEAEEKAKAEKQKLAKEQAIEQAVKAESTDGASANGSKENGSDIPQSGKNFEILRRADDSEKGMTAETDGDFGETVANNEKVGVPKEAGRHHPVSKANGNWRNGGPRNRAPPHAQTPARG